MIERGILQLHRLALITMNLPHKSAPVVNECTAAFSVLLLTGSTHTTMTIKLNQWTHTVLKTWERTETVDSKLGRVADR